MLKKILKKHYSLSRIKNEMDIFEVQSIIKRIIN